MKNIAIIGGTGMLGAPVAKQLRRNGHSVRIVTRNSTRAYAVLGPGFDYREADIFDSASLTTALAGAEGVHINLSGHSERSYYQHHVVGTQHILEAIKPMNMAFISMISVATADPEYSDRADNRYKLAAENQLKASGVPYLIFRPSWFMETLPLFQQKQKLMHIGPSTKPIHWLTAQDYAELVSKVIQDPTLRNKTLTLYGPEPITMADAIQQYAQHKQLRVQKLPVWVAKSLGWLLRDEPLMDVADLLEHYDRHGEKAVADAIRTNTTLAQWLATESAA
ncbi:MAG: NAD(P)H-binding protein [Reinekea sp.]|nr:NAD(P)H-binding protein [Reinekea sp.]